MLDSELTPVTQLTEFDKHRFYDLLCRYFAQTSYEQFTKDLQEKHWVVIMRDQQQVIRGFSTLVIMDFEHKGKKNQAIFSGDTIIHHKFWGTQALPLIWCRLAGQIKRSHPSVPLYWFLIVKGYRTYRYLKVFSKQYYPHWQYPTPSSIQVIMDQLARNKFAAAYDADKGIVRFPQSQGQLHSSWADIPAHVQHKPEIAFFMQANPHYDKGDELVCLTELCASNLKSHARRAFLLGLNEEHPSRSNHSPPDKRQAICEIG